MDTNVAAIIRAAEAGGKKTLSYFGKSIEYKEKTTASDFRTIADIESEKTIVQILVKQFPSYNILSEESGFINQNSEYTFVIDPLDGSNNFILGIPNFAISIGLVKNNIGIIGVVHLPILQKTYFAQQGKGSFLGRKRLFVNKESNIRKATVSYTYGYTVSTLYSEKLIHKINSLKVKRYLVNWSPAAEFCLLASGKIEGIINYKNDRYDYTAGKIIAREAGALITDFNGQSEKDEEANIFIASNNRQIHKKILEIISA